MLVVAMGIALTTSCSLFGPWSIVLNNDEIVLEGVSTATIVLTNRSPIATEFTVVDDTPWLDVEPSSGQLGGFQSAEILLVVDKSYVPEATFRPLERSPGPHPAGLTVSAGNTTAAVQLTFLVAEEPTQDACTPSAASATAALGAPPPYDAMTATPHVAPGASTGPVPTHVIVHYAEASATWPQAGTSPPFGIPDAVAAAYGLRDRQPGPGRGVEVARIPTATDPEAFAAALAADPRVLHAEVDRFLYPQGLLPNDPALELQWALCRFGLPEAWDVSTGTALSGPSAPKTTIAVLDSGVDLDHPDLEAILLPGRDFCPVANAAFTACTTVPSEVGGAAVGDGHGTHVAGIAAAIGNNGTGIAGVAWGGAQVLPVKVFDDAGEATSISALACGIYWAYGASDPVDRCGAPANPNPAAILNLSLGGSGSSATLNRAIADATEAGALVFAASGNADGTWAYQGILMPANAPSAIAVGSVNSNFERSSFSRFDARGGATVDLMAPGGFLLANSDRIYSTYYSASGGACSSYCRLVGTSMAAPFASGAAALVWAENPSWSAAQVRERLTSTAYRAPSWDAREYGAGVLCADAALGVATTCAHGR